MSLLAHMRLLVEACALKTLHPTSRQAIGSYDYRRRQIAFSYPTVSIHRIEAIARKHAAIWIDRGHGRTVRRAKRDAAERASRAAVQQMLAAVEAARAA